MEKSLHISTSIHQATMIAALQATCGNVNRAAEKAHISRQAHYNWYKNDEAYREQGDMIKYESYQEFRDLVMESVVQKLKEDNTSVINRCFQNLFAKFPQEMQRGNPYHPRLVAKIKYFHKAGHGNI